MRYCSPPSLPFPNKLINLKGFYLTNELTQPGHVSITSNNTIKTEPQSEPANQLELEYN